MYNALMKYKKTIIASVVALSLAVTGVTVAASHDEPQKPINKVQSVKMNPQTPPTDTDDVTVTTDSVVSEPLPNPTVPTSASVTEDTPVVQTPLEKFHDTINAQALALAPLFKWSSTEDFIFMQWYCLGSRLDDSVSQADLDVKATFLIPQPNGDGRTLYQYFTGGCKVVQIAR